MSENNSEKKQGNGIPGKILDWLRSALLYGVLIVASEHFLRNDEGTWLERSGTILFIVLVAVYVAAVVAGIVMEKKRYGSGRGTAVSALTPLVYLKDDFLRPFAEVIKSLKCIFTCSKHTGAEIGASVISFIVYAALVAALVIVALRLFFFIVLIGF